MIQGDRRLLQQAVSNLLDNVLRHTPRGTAATVSLTTAARCVSIWVWDDGPGVDAASAPRLFERFFRSKGSSSAQGHGLGFTLVRAVATTHGGKAGHLSGSDFGIELTLPHAAHAH